MIHLREDSYVPGNGHLIRFVVHLEVIDTDRDGMVGDDVDAEGGPFGVIEKVTADEFEQRWSRFVTHVEFAVAGVAARQVSSTVKTEIAAAVGDKSEQRTSLWVSKRTIGG